MMIAHDRLDRGKRIVWLAEQGKQDEFILVFIPGGPGRNQREDDFSHLGFALDSRDAVGVLAARARGEGILEWEPRDEPYPVGYYCGIKDPDGNFVEFSYGQPLGRAHSPRLDVTGRRHGAELTLGFSDALFHHPRVAATINYGAASGSARTAASVSSTMALARSTKHA